MKMGSTIEKIDAGPLRGQFLVYSPYPAREPYPDPQDPSVLIVPLTGFGGTRRTRWGARRLAREFERRIDQEAAA